jgi:hypothetical protein
MLGIIWWWGLSLMLQGFKVAFTAIIVTLLALYAPLLSLNAYSTTLSEVVYEGSNYRVTYKSPLIPLASSDKTSVVLEVKHGGKPVDFGFTLSGITFDGARDVAEGRGLGRASADITGYVDDVVRVLREANSNPAYSGLGLLTFIISKVEEGGEEYIATDIISIPVIPGKAGGKSIVVEVEFKPIHKVKLNKTSSGEQTGKAEVLQTTPPGTITYECKNYIIYQECYKWELTRVHYVSSSAQPIPLSISYIDDTDGNYIKRVEHQHWIAFAPQLSFDLSLVFRKVIDFIVPGPDFTITLPPGVSQLELFRMDCRFMNSYLTSETYDCLYFGGSVGWFTFYKEALIATGIKGRVWLVEYAYVRDRCGLVCYREVLDSSLAVYMVPYFRSTNRIDYSIHIDENPYDGVGWLNGVFDFLYYDSNTTRRLLGVYLGKVLDVWSIELMAKSGSTPLFDIAVPAGAVIRALAGSVPGWPGILISTLSAGVRFHASPTIMSYYAITDRCFYPYYIELTAFLVKDAEDYYKTPFMVVSPSTQAPSQYSPPPTPLSYKTSSFSHAFSSSSYCPPHLSHPP